MYFISEDDDSLYNKALVWLINCTLNLDQEAHSLEWEWVHITNATSKNGNLINRICNMHQTDCL